MALIPITGLPSTYRVPGGYGEIVFAQGPSTAAAGAREIIFIMPKLAASGDWSADTVYQVDNEQQAIDGAGAGSPLHRALRRSLSVNNTAKHWALPYLPSSGAGLVATDGSVTWTTDPSATGVTSVTVCGETFSVAFTDADTVTTIAAAMVAKISAASHLPVTAGNASGVMTLTAKVGGASQGDGTTGVIRYRADIDSGVGTTVATSGAALGLGTGTAGVDGAVTELTGLTTALAVIDAARYYYVGISMVSAAALSALSTHIVSKSEPRSGLRSRGFAAFTGTLTAGQTLSTTENYERLELVQQINSEEDNATLVANAVGVYQQVYELDTASGFDGYRAAGKWLVPAAYDQSDWPDQDDMNDAINDGITLIGSDQRGSFIVMAVTTRSKDAAGSVDDFRAAEPHRVEVMDELLDTILVRDQAQYANKKLKADQLLPNGQVNPNQQLSQRTITPSTYKPFIVGILREFEEAEKLQEVDASVAGLRVVRDPNNTGRLEIGGDNRVIDLAHQRTFRLAEVSPG